MAAVTPPRENGQVPPLAMPRRPAGVARRAAPARKQSTSSDSSSSESDATETSTSNAGHLLSGNALVGRIGSGISMDAGEKCLVARLDPNRTYKSVHDRSNSPGIPVKDAKHQMYTDIGNLTAAAARSAGSLQGTGMFPEDFERSERINQSLLQRTHKIVDYIRRVVFTEAAHELSVDFRSEIMGAGKLPNAGRIAQVGLILDDFELKNGLAMPAHDLGTAFGLG